MQMGFKETRMPCAAHLDVAFHFLMICFGKYKCVHICICAFAFAFEYEYIIMYPIYLMLLALLWPLLQLPGIS